MTTKKREHLEIYIMDCWAVIEDIETVYSSDHLYKDENEMQNVLLGLQSLYKLKFQRLFDTFESLVENGTIK